MRWLWEHLPIWGVIGRFQYAFMPLPRWVGNRREGWHIRWCRFRGHPGIVFYNPGGFEPDMHCTRCGEDTG